MLCKVYTKKARERKGGINEGKNAGREGGKKGPRKKLWTKKSYLRAI